MSTNTFANFEPLEGLIDGTTTFTLKRKSRFFIMTNDHISDPLKYRFSDSTNFGTLGAGETLDFFFNTNTVTLQGVEIPYRIWVYS